MINGSSPIAINSGKVSSQADREGFVPAGAFHLFLLAFLLSIPFLSSSASARTVYQSTDGTHTVRLSGYVKTLALGLNTSLPGSNGTAEDFTRARLMLEGDLGSSVSWTVHYEHMGLINQAGGTTGLFTGSTTEAPRGSLLPLDWTIKETGSFLWRHELDRLNVRFSLPAADLLIGRQAISWGVGRIWNPADLFVAFSPVAVDREFKVGVDAASLKVPLGAFSQVEVVYAAFHADFRDHAVAMRLQRSVRGFDLGMMGGKFFSDCVLGPFVDGEIQGMGVRGEFTFTYDTSHTGPERRSFVRGVTSVDYRFANGLYALLEYYFYGFGEEDPEAYPRLFNSARVARGEVFNFGRHYLGTTLQYEPHPLVTTSLASLWNLLDQSWLIGPLLLVSLSNEADLRAGAYFPIGPSLVGPRVQSEFGLYPQVYYLELRLYF
jgi:hypothetical protein